MTPSFPTPITQLANTFKMLNKELYKQNNYLDEKHKTLYILKLI
ncbi:hypothetical protein BGAFAR04_K0011 (plasmid) [Borreliella garinii Far04]|nr:hypothetical protein BGAFAR04_K0011 [Borreliella garinii Far04]